MAWAVIDVMDRTRVSGTVAERIVRRPRRMATAGRGTLPLMRDMARGRRQAAWLMSVDGCSTGKRGHRAWSRAFRRWRPDAARVNACADAIITVSDRERDQLAARGSPPMTTVHPGFDFHVMAAERRRRYRRRRGMMARCGSAFSDTPFRPKVWNC